jgi:hypothetical protein
LLLIKNPQAPGINQILSTSVLDRRERGPTVPTLPSNKSLERPVAPQGRGINRSVGFTPINAPREPATSTRSRDPAPEGNSDACSGKLGDREAKRFLQLFNRYTDLFFLQRQPVTRNCAVNHCLPSRPATTAQPQNPERLSSWSKLTSCRPNIVILERYIHKIPNK